MQVQNCAKIQAVNSIQPEPEDTGEYVYAGEIEVTRNKRTGGLEGYRFTKAPRDLPEGVYTIYIKQVQEEKP